MTQNTNDANVRGIIIHSYATGGLCPMPSHEPIYLLTRAGFYHVRFTQDWGVLSSRLLWAIARGFDTRLRLIEWVHTIRRSSSMTPPDSDVDCAIVANLQRGFIAEYVS